MATDSNPLVAGGPPANPAPDGAGSPDPSSSAGSAPPVETPPPDLTPLQHELAQLRQQNERLTQQYNGSQQEAARQRADAERLRQEHDQRQQDFQTKLLEIAGVSQGTSAPAYRSMQEAADAWYSGKDPQAFERYEAALEERIAQRSEERVTTGLTKQLGPMARAQQLQQRYPTEMSDLRSEAFKAVYSRYQDLARDPYYQQLFPNDPAFVVSAPDPTDGQMRPIDVRLMEMAVQQHQRVNGIDEGRQQEAARRSQPTVEGRQSGSGAPPIASDAPLMTADERAFIRDHLKTFQDMGWGTTEDAILKHRWTNTISAAEKARRQKLHAAGQWP